MEYLIGLFMEICYSSAQNPWRNDAKTISLNHSEIIRMESSCSGKTSISAQFS